MNIERFVIHDENDQEIGLNSYETLDEARANVPEDRPWAIIALIFEYSDSELIETSTGATSWPPKNFTRTRS